MARDFDVTENAIRGEAGLVLPADEERREQVGLPGSLHAEATDRLAVAA